MGVKIIVSSVDFDNIQHIEVEVDAKYALDQTQYLTFCKIPNSNRKLIASMLLK